MARYHKTAQASHKFVWEFVLPVLFGPKGLYMVAQAFSLGIVIHFPISA
jgi:hypothetical protein